MSVKGVNGTKVNGVGTDVSTPPLDPHGVGNLSKGIGSESLHAAAQKPAPTYGVGQAFGPPEPANDSWSPF